MMRADPILLARDAENLFWVARYMERVENLARLIDVAQSFESPGREAESWAALVAINADETNFATWLGTDTGTGAESDPMAVKRFYLLAQENPTSIPACVEQARTLARTLRPLISTEMWRHINVMHRFVLRIQPPDLEGDSLSRLCTRLKEAVQTHTGVTEGTMYRDQGWQFYQLGRQLERADQTTRLLDIKYRLLVPREHEARRVTELTQWNAVLRAAAGYHAFKRLSRGAFNVQDVAEFLLRDPSFARSVLHCVRRCETHLDDLRRMHHLSGIAPAIERAEYLRATLLDPPMAGLLAGDLHHYLDRVQILPMDVASAIGRGFFRNWQPPALIDQLDQYQG